MLQLLGADVLAVGQDNKVLFAARDVIVAILVDAAQIAGMEPAVRLNHAVGSLLILEISEENIRALHKHLARNIVRVR